MCAVDYFVPSVKLTITFEGNRHLQMHKIAGTVQISIHYEPTQKLPNPDHKRLIVVGTLRQKRGHTLKRGRQKIKFGAYPSLEIPMIDFNVFFSNHFSSTALYPFFYGVYSALKIQGQKM